MSGELTRREILQGAAAATALTVLPRAARGLDSGLALRWDEWVSYDALGLAELVRTQQVTPRELAQQAAAGIAALNPRLNAVIEVFEDRVGGLDEAQLGNGPFRGVPFAWKDLTAGEKGRLQESGSRLLKGFRLPADSVFAARAKRAGLNPLARTTCPEFGFTMVTESSLTGISRNPWNPERTPGGSSGGSAALVAAGILPMAHSNDGGGSTRIPASYCGNIGLKTSRGMVTLAPDGDHLLGSIVSELVNSRSVRDTAAAFDAVFGAAPGEAFPFPKPERPFLAEVGRPTGKLRIAVASGAWNAQTPAPEISAEVKRVAGLLEGMGHAVEERVPQLDYAGYIRSFITIWIAGAGGQVAGIEAMTGRRGGPENLEPIVWQAVQAARKMPALEYLSALAHQSTTSRALGAFFEDWDVLLTPTVAQPTPEVGSRANLLQTDVALGAWFEHVVSLVPYTPLCNYTGVPAISLPLAQLPDGTPLGMHFIAPMGEDARLIRLAAALEEAAPWQSRRPPVHVTTL